MSAEARKRSPWAGRLIVIGGIAAAFYVARITVFRPKPIEVTGHRVDAGLVEDTVVNSRAGTIKSRHRSLMSPGVSGLVIEIPARKGQRVRKGDVLLRLDDREHRSQTLLATQALVAARAVGEQARLEAAHAERQWKRTVELAKNQVVSENALDQEQTRALAARAAAAAAQARIDEAAAALETAEAALAKTVIAAPFDGVILDVATELGEWISPSPPGVPIPPVLDLIDPLALYVSAPIDEADVARIRPGLPVRITMDAHRGQSFSGKLTYVSSFVEARQEQNRTLQVEAEFAGSDLPANVLPGLSADLEVILDSRVRALRVPTYALLENRRVLAVEADRLTEKEVVIGLQNWSHTEIVSGLRAGAVVVTSLDRPEVRAGVRVTVKWDEPP